MPKLHLKHKGFVTTRHLVRDESGELIAIVHFPSPLIAIAGKFRLNGKCYRFRIKGWLNKKFELSCDQNVLATAKYYSTFLHTMLEIQMLGRSLMLQNSFLGNSTELTENDQVLGTITEKFGFWNQSLSASIPDDIPMPESIFLCLIAIQLWSRDMHLTHGRPRKR